MRPDFKSGYGFKTDQRDWTHAWKETGRTSRYWTPGRWVGDQLLTSECVGFAWAHWLTCAPVITWLNPHGIYAAAKFVDEWQGEDYPGTSVRAGAKVLKSLGLITEYAFAHGVDELANAVLVDGPVVTGLMWTADMLEPNADGKIFATGEEVGGHASLIDGVDTDRRIFKVKSSWGLGWGVSGHAVIDFDDVGRLLAFGGELCIAVPREPMPLL